MAQYSPHFPVDTKKNLDSTTMPHNPCSSGKILGVGVDLVETVRIRRIHERHGEAFLTRIYIQEERDYCMAMANPWASLAARFAAKEAVSKALGTGLGAEIGFTSIAVINNTRGAPAIVLDEKATALLHSLGGKYVHISLTHTASLAQAFAVVSA
ncbi:MAG: holo-ACP synthase [Puniceicoccales bacterium]|jgi:holo-[acyl-carrier protein] synthase|nr:holo-ACP synthase [Puniceicoccales bacterium]